MVQSTQRRNAAMVVLAMLAIVFAAFVGSAQAEAPPKSGDGDPMEDVGNATKPYGTDESGNHGYWVFVCQSAAEAGYTGKLNKAFVPAIIDRDMWVPNTSEKKLYPASPRYKLNMDDPALSISRLDSSASDLNAAVDVWDSCDSTLPVASRSFGVKRDTSFKEPLRRWDAVKAGRIPYHSNGDGHPDVHGNGYAQGTLGVKWYSSFKDDTSLEVRQMYFRDELRNVRTKETTARDGLDTDKSWAPGWDAGWIVNRDLSGERAGDVFRMCTYGGTWFDGRYANTWWKDITSDAILSHNEMWADENFSTQKGGSTDASSKFYAEDSIDAAKKAHEYWGNMTGSGTNSAPKSTCRIAYDGEAKSSAGEWYWSDRNQRINGIVVQYVCGEKVVSKQECRGLGSGSGLQEDAGVINRFNSQGAGVQVNGALMFMLDKKAPTVKITGGSLDLNGGALTKKPTSTPDNLEFDASDDAGLRNVSIVITKPNGTKETVRDASNVTSDGLVCDYRYIVPCAGGTGGSVTDDDGEIPGTDTPSNNPPWVSKSRDAMLSDYLINGQELPPGNYTIAVTATDASNQSASDTASFSVGNVNREHDCHGNEITPGMTPALCGTTSEVCTTASTCAPPPTAEECCTGGGSTVPDPTPGKGIFSYDLAVNPTATGSAPPSTGCKVIESVIKGNGDGGGLSDREKNQIISVTLDFSGFSTLGTSLGTQDLRTTFDLPSRRDSRYRNALGCPG